MEGSDERLLAVEDFGESLRKSRLYPSTEESDVLIAEWKRRDREAQRR
jgi:hypothetical protein